MSQTVRIESFSGKGVAIRGSDIDTDQIIPARFMKCVTFEGLGVFAFNDERVGTDGASKNHPFDDTRWQAHPVMAVNANFGCGSSREHAPQALKDYGIRAIVGESFAEIFAGNCSSMGIPVLTLKHDDIDSLQSLIENHPGTVINIDIKVMTVESAGTVWQASMPQTYRSALLDGSWDSTAVLASASDEIDRIAQNLPY